MLPKAHLTSHSRMSGSRCVITPLWLSVSWRSFLCSSSLYSCHFLISSATEDTISVLYCAHPCTKCSLVISNFLEEISSLSHSVVSLYFFALITEEGFLISPCSSLELWFRWVYLSFSPLLLASLLFSAIWKASLDNYFALAAYVHTNLHTDIFLACLLSNLSGLSSSTAPVLRENCDRQNNGTSKMSTA